MEITSFNTLALDLSTAQSGWAVFIDGQLQSAGSFKTDHQVGHDKKLLFISQQITQLIQDYHIHQVIVEDIYRGPNARTFKLLAQVQGVAMLTNSQLGLPPLVFLNASTVRSKLGLPRDKASAYAVLVNWLSFDPKEYPFKKFNDQVDAIALGAAYHRVVLPSLSLNSPSTVTTETKDEYQITLE